MFNSLCGDCPTSIVRRSNISYCRISFRFLALVRWKFNGITDFWHAIQHIHQCSAALYTPCVVPKTIQEQERLKHEERYPTDPRNVSQRSFGGFPANIRTSYGPSTPRGHYAMRLQDGQAINHTRDPSIQIRRWITRVIRTAKNQLYLNVWLSITDPLSMARLPCISSVCAGLSRPSNHRIT